MSEWIPFEEDKPREPFWAANSEQRSVSVWFIDEVNCAVSCGYTHWQPIAEPTDLPPKPLPNLPDGWWWTQRNPDTASFYSFSVWLDDDGFIRTFGDIVPIPIAVIDALREASE